MNGRRGEIRTPDPLVPNQMRYQAALHADKPRIVLRNSTARHVFLFDSE